jgi:hypothetical protein
MGFMNDWANGQAERDKREYAKQAKWISNFETKYDVSYECARAMLAKDMMRGLSDNDVREYIELDRDGYDFGTVLLPLFS